MTQLHPIPSIQFDCPLCEGRLQATGWYMPGMRVLAQLHCTKCDHVFYGDLPTGQGLLQPVLLDRENGDIYPSVQSWFADELKHSYANRSSLPLQLTIEEFRPLKTPYLLNCLDTFYGHCLEKLFNAQHYIDAGVDLLLIVPRFLHWLVPEGVAELWTIDIPLRQGAQWNDWFAEQITNRLTTLDTCALALAFPEPNPDDYAIERFTQIAPFPMDEWFHRLKKPTVTFIWRSDRLWVNIASQRWIRGLLKAARRVGLISSLLNQQRSRIRELAQELKACYPKIDFAVVGMGQPEGFDAWINDMRRTKMDDAVEREWCERYAESHLVIGVHGSNMLLPSALAGSVIELLPPDRNGNMAQDIINVGKQTEREVIFRYRFLPISATPSEVAAVAETLLNMLPVIHMQFGREWNSHALNEDALALLRRKYTQYLSFLSSHEINI
jgi:hypothetical protein